MDNARMQWTSVDPLAEKKPWVSPYVNCSNNPLSRIDPDGKNDYRYDDKTGKFILMKLTKDDTDRVLGYHLDKNTGKYEQNTKWYQTKTRMDGIEKGILKDGINFKEKDNVISVGGKDQASVNGVKSFILQLSKMVGKEIKGFSYSFDGTGKVSDIVLDDMKGMN